MKTRPPFEVDRDVALFLGFLNFYSMYINFFEQRVASLRTLAKFGMGHDITGILKEEHGSDKVDMINDVISDPCIARYDFEKRPYLLTYFSKVGSGYDLCQPNDNPDSMVEMFREMEGVDCEFLRHRSKLLLQSTGFGSCRTRGREANPRSHIGEVFALDWAIHKNRPKLWGVRFT